MRSHQATGLNEQGRYRWGGGGGGNLVIKIEGHVLFPLRPTQLGKEQKLFVFFAPRVGSKQKVEKG